MNNMLNKILSSLNASKDDSILIQNEQYKINKDNFSKIKNTNSTKTISFIDGGNLEIISTPTLSLFFNRIYYTTYKNNKRINNKRFEFYTLITSKIETDSIYYNSEIFFEKEKFVIKNYQFNSLDPRLSFKGKRAKISLVGDIIRRFSELIISEKINSDYVVIDGSLDKSYPFEEELLTNISNKKIFGLSKTNDIITKKGKSINSSLGLFFENKKGIYKVNSNTAFIKLHKNSKHIFKIDSFENFDDELLSLISENSIDPIFLGYPYGLIEADRFARIMNQEKNILELKFITKLKKHIPNIEEILSTKNAHSILDNIS